MSPSVYFPTPSSAEDSSATAPTARISVNKVGPYLLAKFIFRLSHSLPNNSLIVS